MSAIERPGLHPSTRASDAWHVIPAWLPVPGMGVLPVNSFLLKGREPLLVDTGLAALGDAYLSALEAEIDLRELRWIWLSHLDADHAGNLARVLDRAPRVRIVTNFLGRGKMQLAGLDVSRVHLLEPGAALELADRRLMAVRPPYFDAPESLGFFDARDGVLFLVDAFGAVLPEPVTDVGELADAPLQAGLAGWSSLDAPWLALVDQARFGRTLEAIARLQPATLLSGHLPPATDASDRILGLVAEVCRQASLAEADPFSLEHLAATLRAEKAQAA